MESYVKLEDVADERGESPAKVARTLVRQGCDLYLHFGEARKSRVGVSFYPDHPTERMEHNIGAGDHLLTKDSQEALIKRIGREDTSTKGLTVLVYLRHEVGQNEELSNGEIIVHEPKWEVLEYQIELMEKDDTVFVVFDSDDLNLLPPLPIYQGGTAAGSSTTSENIFFSDKNFHNLVLRTMENVHKKTKGLKWFEIRNGLKKNTMEGETIQIVDGYNKEGDSVKVIHFKHPDYMEPYKIAESYFQKTLTAYRSQLERKSKATN